MQVRRFFRSLVACGTIAALAWAAPAKAADVDLGTVTSPTSLVFGNDGLLGPFADVFTFAIGTGDSFGFSAFLSTGFSNRWGILDMQAGLFSGGTQLLAGDAETVYLPEGFPSRDISFDSIVLGAGEYQLRVTGTATSFLSDVPITAGYQGSLDFAAATPAIPEPASVLLMALSLGILGLFARRRVSGSTGAAPRR